MGDKAKSKEEKMILVEKGIIKTDELKIVTAFCQFLTNNSEVPAACMESEKVQNSPKQKLLGVESDSNL